MVDREAVVEQERDAGEISAARDLGEEAWLARLDLVGGEGVHLDISAMREGGEARVPARKGELDSRGRGRGRREDVQATAVARRHLRGGRPTYFCRG